MVLGDNDAPEDGHIQAPQIFNTAPGKGPMMSSETSLVTCTMRMIGDSKAHGARTLMKDDIWVTAADNSLHKSTWISLIRYPWVF